MNTVTPTEASPSTTPFAGANSPRVYELAALSAKELNKVFLRGSKPDLSALEGWEFRGFNQPIWARAVGIKKFFKGFFREHGELYGYNYPAVQNGDREAWLKKHGGDERKRFGYYRVADVDARAKKDNRYLHSVLLNYGQGGNHNLDPSANIRDYLVQVDPDNRNLYLGKAYYAVGPLRVHSNFFFLERHQEVEGQPHRPSKSLG